MYLECPLTTALLQVRAMKIPTNVASISHDSSVGAEPHNYFSIAFNGATFEQRTGENNPFREYRSDVDSNRFVAQSIYLMRYATPLPLAYSLPPPHARIHTSLPHPSPASPTTRPLRARAAPE